MPRLGNLVLVAGLLAALVALAACSGGGAAASVTPPPDADASLVAQSTKFDQQTLTVPAGRATRLFFKNLDSQPHNVAIFTDASKSTKAFTGETITDAAIVYDIPPLQPGTYPFHCDVHPDMTGTITVGG
jgi:plastocyanin